MTREILKIMELITDMAMIRSMSYTWHTWTEEFVTAPMVETEAESWL